jgi:hypothetical protein
MTFPLRFPDDDPRFSPALIDDIDDVLTRHGYPSATDDATAIADLRAALAGFLYGSAFNKGDKVAWVRDSKVWYGKVQYVATGDNGPVARIKADPQPGDQYYSYPTVPCRELTLVRDGVR